MKKCFIFAAVAVVATAACTKVETVDNSPETPIAFQVVNYQTQTKAYNSLLDESAAGAQITSFTTNAWFHGAGSYGVQQFMADESIVPDNTTNPTKWAPSSRDYYWPKTGYINFFSYAGSPAPTAKAEGSLTYTDVSVVPASNILVADAAYRFKENNDPATYGQNSVTKGVPTLFRHKLAKVKFDVILDASETQPAYAWTATIKEASITVPQKGTLALTVSEPSGTTPATAAYTGAWASLSTLTPINKVSGDVVLKAKGEKKSDVDNVPDGSTAGKAAELIADSAVIPHTLTNDVVFNMTYTLAFSYNGGTEVKEDIVIDPTKLTDFTPSITAWAMNTVYTYHIIIKPNGVILFDPAVETWEPEAQEPVQTY